MPQTKTITLQVGSQEIPVTLPDRDFIVIFVKAVNLQHPPVVYITGFNRLSAVTLN